MPKNTYPESARIVKFPAYVIALIFSLGVQGYCHIAFASNSDTNRTRISSAPVLSMSALAAHGESQNKRPDHRDVVAVIDGHDITAADLDASIQMQLYDLDLARHELRLRQLKRIISEQAHAAGTADPGDTPDVEIFLEPPAPPRFNVGSGNNEVRGNPGAPVTIIQFLDFQSPHSKRAQPVLHQVLEDYDPVVRLVVRDFPLPYHRHARQAALAAECARAQGGYWRYHDLLLQNQDNLTPTNLIHYATTLGLDLKRFQACLDNETGAIALKEDMDAAHRLGLHSTPVFFINGLYHKGPPEYSDIARIINLELVRLGILNEEVIRYTGAHQCPFSTARRSTLPLALIGTVIQENPLESSAILHNQSDNSTNTLKPGDTLLEGVELVLAVRDRAYLQQENRLDFLPLSDLSDETKPSEEAHSPSRAADAVLSLHRTDIDIALKKIDKLEAGLASGSLDLEGKRLLKLTDVETGDLFDLLGLQTRDVLMQVNGKWVHDQHNPLWEALRTQNEVTLTIMRKGFPKTFQYVINEDSQ